MNEQVTKKKWLRLKLYSEEAKGSAQGSALPEHLFLSRNEKTGVSLNVAMVGTCRPTKVCRANCYGTTGPVAFHFAVRKQVENLTKLRSLEHDSDVAVDSEADFIANAVAKSGQDFLRINGVGDLVRGTVRLVKALASRHPWLALWVSTRKPELAELIPVAKSVHVMLSIDKSTKSEDLQRMRSLVRSGRGQRFLAYTQTSADDVPPVDVAVVFAEHHGASRAKWVPDKRTCGATIRQGFEGYVPHSGACENCRRCFDKVERCLR